MGPNQEDPIILRMGSLGAAQPADGRGPAPAEELQALPVELPDPAV